MAKDVEHLFMCLWWKADGSLEQDGGSRDDEKSLILDMRDLERRIEWCISDGGTNGL